MTLWTKTGTLTKDTTTGAHNQTFSSLWTEAPKAIIFWATKNTSADTFIDAINVSIGWSDGTDDTCLGLSYQDAVTTSNAWATNRTDSCIDILDDSQPSSGASLARGNVNSITSTDLVINWTVANATQYLIKYWAIGGSDITNTKVINTTTGSVATGTLDKTGFGFQPDFVMMLAPHEGYTTTNGISGSGNVWSFGAGLSSSNNWSMTLKARDNNSSGDDSNTMTRNDTCHWACNNSTTDTVTSACKVNAFISDGVQLDVTTAFIGTNARLAFLAFKGGLWDMGTFTQRSGTGTQDVNITAGRVPAGVFLVNTGTTTLGTITTTLQHSIGAADGTNEGCTSQQNVSGAATTALSQRQTSSKVLTYCNANATATSSTIVSAADMNDMATAGKFQLNWTTADSTARQICYVTVSPSEAETETVSETSIHKYDIAAYATQTNIHKYNIIAEVLRAHIHKYDILNTVPPQTSIHKYDLRNNIAQTTIHKYNLLQNALATSIQKYNLLQFIAQTSIQKYHLLQNILQSSIHKYSLLVNVLQNSIHKYDIIALGAVVQTLIAKYDIRQYIAQTNIHKYNLLAYIVQNSIHKYNLLQNVLQSNIHKYNLLANVVRSSIQKYDILANVLRSNIQKYHLFANALQSSIHKYNLVQNILQNSIHKYNIDVLGAVVNALIAKYDIRAYIAQSNIAKYNILQNILQSSIHKYNLLINILQTSIHKYSLLQSVVSASIQKYGILQQVLSSSLHKYNILVEALTVLQSSIHKYHLLNTIAQTSRHKYDLFNTVARTSIQKYNILQQILQNSIQKYHMGGVVFTQSRHVYNLVREILGTSVSRGVARIIPPKLRQIKYPVYHVDDMERIQRQLRLRSTQSTVIPAFMQNIHKTVAPFVITAKTKNKIIVRFAVAQKSPVIFTAKRPIPVQIEGKIAKKEAQKAKSTHIMQQKAIEKYGKRLNKFAKLMKLFLLAEEYDKLSK